jgi:hypothetical protein
MAATQKFTYKDRPFELDRQNNLVIMQHRNSIRTFIEEFQTKVSRIDQDLPEMRKIQKQEEEYDLELKKKLEELRKELEKNHISQKELQLEREAEATADQQTGSGQAALARMGTFSKKRGSLQVKQDKLDNEKDKIEVEILAIMNYQEKQF